MNEPVSRFDAYPSTKSARCAVSVRRPISVQAEGLGREVAQRVHVLLELDALDRDAARLGRVLDEVALAGVERRLVQPDDLRLERALHLGHVARVDEHVAPAHVNLVFEAQRHRLGDRRELALAVERVDRLHAARLARGEHHHGVALAHDARRHAPGEAAVIEVGAHHVLHGVAEVRRVAIEPHRHLVEELEHRRPVVPGRVGAAAHAVRALQRADGEERDAREVEALGEGRELLAHGLEDRRVEPDEVHLVHADREVRDAEERGDVRVPPALLEHAEPRVDEHDRDRRRRRAGDHVARVLHVPGRVGDDELAALGREIPVRDVNRDALLALGREAVGDERQVDVGPRHVARLAGRGELVFVYGARVEEQAADERRLAVVHGADRHEAEELLVLVAAEVGLNLGRDGLALGGFLGGHQKYPSRFLFSIEASSSWSMRRP